MDKEDLKALNRARVTAGWSYLGAIVPLVGWILGAISLSNLGSIEVPDNGKAKRRIGSVKKLALGGIILSTIVALAYGAATYWNIQNNNKTVQAAASADEKSCEQQVIDYNNKVFALNGQYTSPKSNPVPGPFDNSTNVNDCKKSTSSATSTAKTNYASALRATNARCLDAADQTYTHNLQINAVSTSKDASGQTIYNLSQANSTRVQQQYQTDKDSCATQFPTT